MVHFTIEIVIYKRQQKLITANTWLFLERHYLVVNFREKEKGEKRKQDKMKWNERKPPPLLKQDTEHMSQD